MSKKRRKAPKHCFWKGDVLWGRQTIAGRKYRWSLRTDDVLVAAKRVEADRARRLTAATYGDDRTTYQQAVVGWAKNFLTDRAVSKNTTKRYAVSLRQLEPYLLDRYIDGLEKTGIDSTLIGEIVSGRRDEGVSTATIKRDLGALASVLTYGQIEGWRTDNPALERIRLLKERRDPIVLPDSAHIALVIQRCPGLIAAMVQAARATGARESELVTALRGRLDHNRRELTVIGKGNKLRVIDLRYGGGYELLRALPSHVKSKHLFWHGQGEPYRNFASRFSALVREVFAAAYDRVHGTNDDTRPKVAELIQRQDDTDWQDIGFRTFTFHDLRHLHAVEYLRAGYTIYDLQQRLGHASITTTELYLKFLTPEQQLIAKHGTQKWTPQAHDIAV